MDSIACGELPALFQAVSRVFEEKKDLLCGLDAKMGDGDLGLTMSKGFGALPGLLRENMQQDVGKTLMKAAMAMSSVVPSTMGTLMASGIMEGGKALRGRTEINAAGLSVYLSGFEAGIRKRGKCETGDRTILDAVAPAAGKAAALLAGQPSARPADVIGAAVQGAKAGVEATKSMTPKFGKAAVFAARAIGVPDQGAVAALAMLVGMRNYLCG